VRGVVVERDDGPPAPIATTATPLPAAPAVTDPPPSPPPPAPPLAPPRSYLYGPDAGFPRGATISVGTVVDAPGLVAAVAWWDQLAGRSIYTVGTGSTQVTIRSGDGVCGSGAVACSAPVSAIDHKWHSDMSYPYEHCDVYVRTGFAGDWTVLAHEMGHCLGFDHVFDRASVMNQPPHPDPADRAMLESAGYV
jgi:hypothetical protein